MGLIAGIFDVLFGGGRNVLKETAEVFTENAEAAGQREHHVKAAALNQFAAEFAVARKGRFDRFMDGLNRLPRPLMAFGTLGLFVSAMVDPIWFASRMQGLALVPDPLWWLLGAIVGFYFGARHQQKSQEFQESLATTLARAPDVIENTRALRALGDEAKAPPEPAAPEPPAPQPPAPLPPAIEPQAPNAALEDWRRTQP